MENDDNYKNIFQVKIQKEFKTTLDYIILNVDEEQKYTMGVYLCLNDTNIHNINIEEAIHIDTIKTLQDIKDNNINFIYFSQASQNKKKAEQLACQYAIDKISQK